MPVTQKVEFLNTCGGKGRWLGDTSTAGAALSLNPFLSKAYYTWAATCLVFHLLDVVSRDNLGRSDRAQKVLKLLARTGPWTHRRQLQSLISDAWHSPLGAGRSTDDMQSPETAP